MNIDQTELLAIEKEISNLEEVLKIKVLYDQNLVYLDSPLDPQVEMEIVKGIKIYQTNLDKINSSLGRMFVIFPAEIADRVTKLESLFKFSSLRDLFFKIFFSDESFRKQIVHSNFAEINGYIETYKKDPEQIKSISTINKLRLLFNPQFLALLDEDRNLFSKLMEKGGFTDFVEKNQKKLFKKFNTNVYLCLCEAVGRKSAQDKRDAIYLLDMLLKLLADSSFYEVGVADEEFEEITECLTRTRVFATAYVAEKKHQTENILCNKTEKELSLKIPRERETTYYYFLIFLCIRQLRSGLLQYFSKQRSRPVIQLTSIDLLVEQIVAVFASDQKEGWVELRSLFEKLIKLIKSHMGAITLDHKKTAGFFGRLISSDLTEAYQCSIFFTKKDLIVVTDDFVEVVGAFVWGLSNYCSGDIADVSEKYKEDYNKQVADLSGETIDLVGSYIYRKHVINVLRHDKQSYLSTLPSELIKQTINYCQNDTKSFTNG